MRLFKKTFAYIFDKNYRFIVNSNLGFHKKMDDIKFLKKKFLICNGYPLDLDNPKSFNEKLQWLKINYHNDECSLMVDKYEVKRIVGNKIGTNYIVPTYGVWNSFDEINFDELPDSFVLKCTHDCGGSLIVKNKKELDIKKARKFFTKCLKKNYYYFSREWPYKNIKPRIIAEKYLVDSQTRELRDYKFFAFNGQVRALFVATDRQSKSEDTKFDFYDIHFQHLPIIQGHNNSNKSIQKPKNFEKMVEFASKLSEGLPHVRCDFYEADGNLYFGELTFFHYGGFVPFNPIKWDYIFGDWLYLPNKQ